MVDNHFQISMIDVSGVGEDQILELHVRVASTVGENGENGQSLEVTLGLTPVDDNEENLQIWVLRSGPTSIPMRIRLDTITPPDFTRPSPDEYISGSDEYISGSDEYITGSDEYVTGQDEYVIGPDEYVTGRDESVTGRDEYVTGQDEYVTEPDQYMTSPDQYVTGPDLYVTGSDEYVTSPDQYVTGLDEYDTSPHEYLTSLDEYETGPNEYVILPKEPTKELKLSCPICMDVMEEETSTICGHLFCRGCILAALAVQKKCPTCRHELTATQIHKIYIS